MNSLDAMKLARMEHKMQEAVNSGAKWLDEYDHDWYTMINLSTLDLAEGACCVLGQVFETEAAESNTYYEDGFAFVQQTMFTYSMRMADEQRQDFQYGFNLPSSLANPESFSENHCMSLLTEMWIEQVEKRRANDGSIWRA
jgi:hypothetical protein